jgi:hypothetical protein
MPLLIRGILTLHVSPNKAQEPFQEKNEKSIFWVMSL